MNHCKIENYSCPNVPDGETCVCVGCGNLYFRKTDEGCYCDEPCQAFWDMMDRSVKKKTENWEASNGTKVIVSGRADTIDEAKADCENAWESIVMEALED